MTRRTLLGSIGTMLLPAKDAQGIIDSHVHFYDPARPQGVPWPSNKTDALYRTVLPGPWEKMVRPLGVTGVIVVEASPWLEDNQWILDLAKTNPIIVGFVGHLEPGAPAFAANLDRFRRNPIFRGIRLNAAALKNPPLEDLRRLADSDLALDVLGDGPMLLDVARLNDRLPHLRIVINHLPFDAPAGELHALKSRPNVYAKVSGAIQKLQDTEAMDEVYETFGPDRVIYASNWPVCERLAPYAGVLQAVHRYFDSRGPGIAEKYFRTNSASAYRYDSHIVHRKNL